MKKWLISALLMVPFTANAGAAKGTLTNVKISLQNNLLMAVVKDFDSGNSCVTWDHHLAMAYTGTDAQKAYLSLLLTAYASGDTVRIVTSSSCLSGTGALEMLDIDISKP